MSQQGIGDLSPFVSSDGERLYFFTGSGPGAGDGENWIANREPTNPDLWQEPTLLEGPINDPAFDHVSIRLSGDELSMVFISAPAGDDDYGIFTATRQSTSEPFGNIQPIEEVNTTLRESGPTLSADGRLLLYSSPTGPAGFNELRAAYRLSPDEPFSTIVEFNELGIGNLNSDSVAEFSPYLSPNWPSHGSELYFLGATVGSDWDIYKATWFVDGCNRPNTLIGDIDGDGVVAFADFLSLSASFGKSEDVQYTDGDLNCDGRVEFSDFLELSANFGHTLAATSQVPEPNTFSVSFIALGCLCLRRKRHHSYE